MGIKSGFRIKSTLAVAFFMIVAFLAVSCSGTVATQRSSGSLTELPDVEELATLFNQDDGNIRLVLLLSPT